MICLPNIFIDENRQRVLQHQGLQAILAKFKDNQLVDIAVPAAFNICNDYGKCLKSAHRTMLTADEQILPNN